MLTCRLTIKIKDYFPKTDSIPYSNYICLFTCDEYKGQIPFLPDESKFLQHQIKNITSDIKYKILVLDFNDMSLIGMCEMTILYKILNRIIPQNGFAQEQSKKLLIDMKTKRKLFDTVINSGDIYLNIYTEVFLVSKNINEQKQKNLKLKKNNPVINTPKCYIKYNFTLNKSDFSPKSSKNNKSTMMNSGSEKQTLNLSKQEKENNTNRYSNINSVNFKKEKEKKNLANYSNYNIINNNINFFNKKSEADIYNNKKNIMDLLQHKKMMEEIVEEYNKNDLDEKLEIEEDDYIYNNKLYINNKEGYLTEQNFNSKFINKNNKFKPGNNIYKLNNKINNNINNEEYNVDDEEEEEENKNFIYYSKNTMSPNEIRKNYIQEENIKMSNTIKNKNVINPNNIINQNFIYSSKNKMMKMGKIYTKAKINGNMKNNININNNNNNNNISRKSNDAIYQNYLTNTNFNNYNNNYNHNDFTQIESNNNTYMNNTNTNLYNNITNINNNNTNYNQNNINSQSSRNSEEEEEGEDDYLDIDRVILDKGAELRNDFQTQIKLYSVKTNNHKTINSLSNNNNFFEQNQNNFNNNKNINYNSRTPYAEKISKYSSIQSLNSYLTQEDVKNNCIKLIEFYSLLNLKLKKIYPKNTEIKQKLIIFKELLSSELKKRNLITNKLNKNNYIYNLSTNINETTNEKILSHFPKIKKIENSIYQRLFNVFNTQEELAKFSEFENYDKQTKIFLLLNLARNLVKKYGNISQIYTIKNSVNIKKKKKLKKCLQNYLINEKDANDKEFVNLENINRDIQNRNELSEENKFKVIKEVDEDKEEENDLEEENGIKDWNEQDEIKEFGDENRDQIIDDPDLIEENNNNNKTQSDEHLKENNHLDNYINIEDNCNQNKNKNSDSNINNNINIENEEKEEKENINENNELNDNNIKNEEYIENKDNIEENIINEGKNNLEKENNDDIMKENEQNNEKDEE